MRPASDSRARAVSAAGSSCRTGAALSAGRAGRKGVEVAAAAGVTTLEGAEFGEGPAGVGAFTRKGYVVPLVSPRTSADGVSPGTVVAAWPWTPRTASPC